jgi:hypothetical protein
MNKDERCKVYNMAESTLRKAHADMDVRAPSITPCLCNYFFKDHNAVWQSDREFPAVAADNPYESAGNLLPKADRFLYTLLSI